MVRTQLLAAALAVALTGTAFAQAKKTPPPAAAAALARYFTSFGDLMDGEADVILKQIRSGTEVRSASIDLCFPAPKGTERRDRVFAELKVNGQSLNGAGTSMLGKTPVEFALTQTRSRGKPGAFDFGGTIKIGADIVAVASSEVTDISEREFSENTTAEDLISPAPANFTEASPESIAAKVAIDAVPAFIAGLRGKSVLVTRNSLLASCEHLRAGAQTIQMVVNPGNAADIVAQLKTQPGVSKVGWSYGTFERTRTIRFAAGGWLSSGRVDNARIGAAIGEALKTALAASSITQSWDEHSGKHTLRLRRPDAALGSLGLVEELEFTAMAAFEKPGEATNILLWLGMPWSKLIDGAEGSKPLLIDSPGSEQDERVTGDGDAVAVLAKYFKAQRWDEDASQFK